MTLAPLSPRVRAAHQRRDLVPVAASSCLDRTMTPTPARLLAWSCLCNRTAGAFMVEASAIAARDGVPSAASADAAASCAQHLKLAQYLAYLAQRPDQARAEEAAAHAAAGGVVLLKQADGAGRVVVADGERPAAQPVGLKRLLMKLGQRLRKVA